MVFYQLLVGKPPFEGSTPVVLMHSHLNEAPPRPSASIHEIPKVLDELVVNLMAKLPTDRPWDAAAVGVKLTELREKVNSGAHWDGVSQASAGGKSAKAGSKRGECGRSDSMLAGDEPGTAAPRRKTRKARTLAGLTGRDRTETGGPAFLAQSVDDLKRGCWSRRSPRSGDSSRTRSGRRAPPFCLLRPRNSMQSTRPFDWTTRATNTSRNLTSAFRIIPTMRNCSKWRDKILLEGAESRSGNLASGLDIAPTRPVNDAERKFVVTNGVADAAKKRFDELAAMAQWQEMGDQLKEAAKPHFPDDPVERQWYLLSLRRVEQLRNAIKDRREYVVKQMELADLAFRGGRPNEAENIRAKLVEQFGKYTDLADIFQTPASASERPDRNASGEPAPAAKTGESDPPAAAKTGAEGKDAKDKEALKGEPESVPAEGAVHKDESAKPAPKSEPKESEPEV